MALNVCSSWPYLQLWFVFNYWGQVTLNHLDSQMGLAQNGERKESVSWTLGQWAKPGAGEFLDGV